MNLGVVINNESNNYGDDIQTIAAARLLPKVDYYLDRENLNSPGTSNKIKLLCNGWYMNNPLHWPPANNINPLFISFHVSHFNNSSQLMFRKEFIEYYKKHEPIGCRDYHTVNLFKSIGIDAYFSGCLTMTLENKYKESDRNEDIIFVDAINSKFPKKMQDRILNKLIPNSIKNHIKFSKHYHSEIYDNESRLVKANKLLDMYSKAHLVVTSRIHVALPCLALGTPVMFLDLGFNTKDERNRFGGLIEYFGAIGNNVFPFTSNSQSSKIYKKLRLYNLYYDKKPIDYDWENPPKPSPQIKVLAKNLRETVNKFIQE